MPQVFSVWGANGIVSMRHELTPLAVPVLLSPAPGSVVARDRDLVITWDPDPAMAESDGVSTSMLIDVSLPRGGERESIRAAVPDDGVFVIAAASLRRSDSGTVEISLDRTTRETLRTTDDRAVLTYARSRCRMSVTLP